MNTHYYLAHTDPSLSYTLTSDFPYKIWNEDTYLSRKRQTFRSLSKKRSNDDDYGDGVTTEIFISYHVFRKGHKTQRYKIASTNQETEARESEGPSRGHISRHYLAESHLPQLVGEGNGYY